MYICMYRWVVMVIKVQVLQYDIDDHFQDWCFSTLSFFCHVSVVLSFT